MLADIRAEGSDQAEMLEKKLYANGQQVWDLRDNRLTYFFTDGTVKAEGPYRDDQMDGEWRFYRQTGQLWVIGNFKQGQKHGSWTRWDKADQVEYQETFADGKLVRRK